MGNLPIHVHKSILCNSARFFQAALKGDFEESHTEVLELPKDNREVFGHFLTWLYTGYVDSSSSSCYDDTLDVVVLAGRRNGPHLPSLPFVGLIREVFRFLRRHRIRNTRHADEGTAKESFRSTCRTIHRRLSPIPIRSNGDDKSTADVHMDMFSLMIGLSFTDLVEGATVVKEVLCLLDFADENDNNVEKSWIQGVGHVSVSQQRSRVTVRRRPTMWFLATY